MPGMPTSQYHRAGKPIGYFAARNTIYQKKIFSGKLAVFCFLILPVLIVLNLVIILLPVLLAVANHTLSVSVMHIYASNITQPQET